MTIQLSTAIRNALLDVVESTIGATAILRLRTGAPPATCATADSGTIVSEMTLPADWMNAAGTGTKTLLGTWQDLLANAAGTVAHFRIYDSGGTVCGMQGTVTISGGGGDMTLDNNVLAINQPCSITSFTLTAPNP